MDGCQNRALSVLRASGADACYGRGVCRKATISVGDVKNAQNTKRMFIYILYIVVEKSHLFDFSEN